MSRAVLMPIAVLVCATVLATCSDDTTTSSPTPSTGVAADQTVPTSSLPPPTLPPPSIPPPAIPPPTIPAPAPTRAGEPTLPNEPIDVGDIAFTDPAITGPAETVCRSLGGVGGDPDALRRALADDATIVDAVDGVQYVGADGVARYSDVLTAEGVDDAACIHLVQSDHWVGHTVALSYDDGDVQAGILAIHVRPDGSVDRLVTHFSNRAEVATPRVDSGTGVLSTSMGLCERWIDRDADGILALMSPEPIVHTQRDVVGRDAIAAFATDLPDDIHTCGVEIQMSEWQSSESIMTDPDEGTERSMLSVLRLDAGGLVAEQWFYFDA